MRGRRRRLFIHKVCTGSDNWVQGDENIVAATCNHFQEIFIGHQTRSDRDRLSHIPKLVDEKQNQILQTMPTVEELKHVVLSMNPILAAGLGVCVVSFIKCVGKLLRQIY